MGNLPHDIIRQIILESTREERSRKDALDYWTRLWQEGGKPVRVQYKALKEVHNQMKQVTRLERDACHVSVLPLPGSKQADEGGGNHVAQSLVVDRRKRAGDEPQTLE